MPPETDPAQWIARARADLRVARLVLGDSALPDWPAGFHVQQAAEKALKAVLVARAAEEEVRPDAGVHATPSR